MSKPLVKLHTLNLWPTYGDDDAGKARADLDKNNAIYEQAEKSHKENLPLIEKNIQARLEIGKLMDELGVPRTYIERDQKSRKAIKPFVTRNSGWVLDMDRFLPVDDGFEAFSKKYKAYVESQNKRIEELEAQEAQARDRKVKANEAEAEKRAMWVRVGMLSAKYGLPETTTERELFEHILNQNPLLNLANAMRKTRGDWSYGFWRVEHALHKVSEVEYPEIVADILDCMSDDDGRVFRDTTYNYDVLFGMVDEELYKDYDELYNILYSLHDDWYSE